MSVSRADQQVTFKAVIFHLLLMSFSRADHQVTFKAVIFNFFLLEQNFQGAFQSAEGTLVQ